MTDRLGEPIATRTLRGNTGPVTVTIGRPHRDADRPDLFVCPFRIGGRPDAVGVGLDEVQALLSALRIIGAVLALPDDWPVSRPR
ncbi:DUF6968 family protein [Nocardia sp. NPDC003482]|uniref:DUF6968 family protein n=1 Tax=Nocardia sp. NPDC004068 TaxID=3364303 RepID=UPI0036CAB1C1